MTRTSLSSNDFVFSTCLSVCSQVSTMQAIVHALLHFDMQNRLLGAAWTVARGMTCYSMKVDNMMAVGQVVARSDFDPNAASAQSTTIPLLLNPDPATDCRPFIFAAN